VFRVDETAATISGGRRVAAGLAGVTVFAGRAGESSGAPSPQPASHIPAAQAKTQRLRLELIQTSGADSSSPAPPDYLDRMGGSSMAAICSNRSER